VASGIATRPVHQYGGAADRAVQSAASVLTQPTRPRLRAVPQLRPGEEDAADWAGLPLPRQPRRPGVPPGSVVIPRPRLFDRLGQSDRVTLLSAPPGAGKTVLLRSWIAVAGLAEQTGWVTVPDKAPDPGQFWTWVLEALRGTGTVLVPEVTAAAGLDGWAIVDRLIEDLRLLEDPVWLVIDDLHKLAKAETVRQLELLVTRAPAQLRLVLSTRRDLRLGLHRMRLEGTLAEIRADDLRFTAAEARALFEAAGITLPDLTLDLLRARVEGWAAGLRLAALALARHPDPHRLAGEFCGSERTVAEYLLAEVLDPQPEPVRRMLLRTSVLDRVNGDLADALTQARGSERILQDLEEASGFVQSLDASRTWFRYHSLFSDLLRLELSRNAAGELHAVHATAADWYARHGHPLEAIRHARAAIDSAVPRSAVVIPAPRGCGVPADHGRTGVTPPVRTRPAEHGGTGRGYGQAPLTESEIRVLCYLPSHLTAQEIAGELNLSVHTVTTHMRHLYAKLGVHRRHEAVDRARALGALAPAGTP
jgi:ATP/maltotriose-dependent transcriptional regulator MalT